MVKYVDQTDRMIAAAIKELEVEAEQGMPDVEAAWADFEKRIKAKESKQKRDYKKYLLRLALVASIALALMLSTQHEKVTAFKNEAVRWLGKDADQGIMITELQNPGIEKGTYSGLTFDDTQEKTLFHLVKPTFLPAGVNKSPEIQMDVYEYPWVLVKMTYKGEKQKTLILQQENSPGNEQRNTFVPQNSDLEQLNIDNRDVILLKQEEALNAKWVENGIRYTVTTYKISKDELLEIIKHLK